MGLLLGVVMENWRSNYTELTGYVAAHPDIEITDSVMVIPDDVRAEFYRLFNSVLARFVKDLHPGLLPESSLLSAKFAEARESTIACLKLNSVELNPELTWFLEDAVAGLGRKLFDPLFSLLQGKTDPASFERSGAEITGTLSRALMHRGYMYWVMMSLMQLMAPEGVFSVPVIDETIQPDQTTADKRPGWFTEEVPDISPVSSLRLDVSQFTPFLVPKVILQSGKLNAFAAIRTDFYNVFHNAKDRSKHLEWLSREAIRRDFGLGDIWPDMAVYLGETGKDLRVVADYSVIARPDITLDVMEAGDWCGPGGVEKVKRHYHVLKPRLGSFVVSRQPVSQAVIDELQPDIKVLVAGYDVCSLAPIIDTLLKGRSLEK